MSEIRYERPVSARDACALLADETNRARVLAGGTDLLIDVRARGDANIGMFVDIKRIPGIDELEWRPSGELVLGAAVTMRTIYEDARLAATYPALADGAETVGSIQVRTRATLGGNLANASPCMDTAPPLMVLDARLVIAKPDGTDRQTSLKEFFLGVKRTTLAPGELITRVIVPASSEKLKNGFEKIKRVNGHDLALVNAAASYDSERHVLRAVIGSCGITPIPTPDLTHVDPKDVEEIGNRLAKLALENVAPISDVRASQEYRNAMVAHLCRRLVRRLLAGQEG